MFLARTAFALVFYKWDKIMVKPLLIMLKKEGLIANFVSTIYKDKKGELWLGLELKSNVSYTLSVVFIPCDSFQ